MLKRKYDDIKSNSGPGMKNTKNSLDSDEEDEDTNEEAYNVMNEDDFEGTEDGPTAPETNVGFTAFNMKEELEEGHFDKDGHYLWNKEKEIRDNWLDNIDWVQIKTGGSTNSKAETETGDDVLQGLTEKESDDDDDDEEDADLLFDPTQMYKQLLEYLKPGETVSKALCRLGKGKKRLTTAERWKKKKQGKEEEEEDQDSEKITKLTELANTLLTRTGNMDIYQETYDQIRKKVELGKKHCHPSKQEAELDMYADDFDEKEKAKLDGNETGTGGGEGKEEDQVTWEFKWSQNEDAEIHGPYTTREMQAWSKEGYFKTGAWVRRAGSQNQFYSAARMDFELYL